MLDILGRLHVRDPLSGTCTPGGLVGLTQRWLTPATVAAFAGDGRTLATIDTDRQTVKVWESASGREVAVLRGLSVPGVSVAISADGGRVAAVGLGHPHNVPPREVRVWDTSTGQTLATFKPNSGPVSRLYGAVALSPDGRRVAFDDYAPQPPGVQTKEQARVQICDVDSGSAFSTLRTGQGRLTCLTFHADGGLLAAGGMEGGAHVWNVRTGESLHAEELEGPSFRLAFSPDGRRLAGLDREQVKVWDVGSGKGLLTLRGVRRGRGTAASTRPWPGALTAAGW